MSIWSGILVGVAVLGFYTLLFSLGAVSARADEETSRDARARLRRRTPPRTVMPRAGRRTQGAAR